MVSPRPTVNFNDKDFDEYIADRFPKLQIPFNSNNNDETQNKGKPELNANPITEEDLYDVVSINFNYDNLYLKEGQLSDF